MLTTRFAVSVKKKDMQMSVLPPIGFLTSTEEPTWTQACIPLCLMERCATFPHQVKHWPLPLQSKQVFHFSARVLGRSVLHSILKDRRYTVLFM